MSLGLGLGFGLSIFLVNHGLHDPYRSYSIQVNSGPYGPYMIFILEVIEVMDRTVHIGAVFQNLDRRMNMKNVVRHSYFLK